MSATDDEKRVIQELLLATLKGGAFPKCDEYRVAHEADRALLDALVTRGFIAAAGGRYAPTLAGLRTCGSREAKAEIESAAFWLGILQKRYRTEPSGTWTLAEFMESTSGFSIQDVGRQLVYLVQRDWVGSNGVDPATWFVLEFFLREAILDAHPGDITGESVASLKGWAELPRSARIDIRRISIDGYRPFREFTAELGDLTVVIGANAAGKSSLIDFLRWLQAAVRGGLPPYVDERWMGQKIFHAGRPEKITFGLMFVAGQPQILRYEAEVRGPVDRVNVAREWLGFGEATVGPASLDLLDFAAGHGTVLDVADGGALRTRLSLASNELALSRARDPTSSIATRVRDAIDSWRFFSGFDVSPKATIRRPAASDEHATLIETGENLSAVLHRALLENPDVVEEMSTHLRSAVPGFEALHANLRGVGKVIGTWGESGVDGELTLGDLSDGTLRFLCWAVLCLAPDPPPLVCVEEPEVGLHPRVLPVLAGLFRMLSGRTQVLVTTHSPYLLSRFRLDEVAVMRKDDGRAVFVRPASSEALRAMVEEIGDDALARLFVSDELETVP